MTQTAQETFNQRIEREKQDRAVFNEAMYAKYEEVAKILNCTYEGRPSEMEYNAFGYFKRDNVSFYIVASNDGAGWSKKGMMHIASNLPKDRNNQYVKPRGDGFPYGYQCHEIYISVKKTAEQIARDIEKRFIPIHTKEHQNVVAQISDSNAYYDARENMLVNVSRATLIKVEPVKQGQVTKLAINTYGNKFEMISKNEAVLSLRVSEKQAIALLKLAQKVGVLV